MPALLGVVAEPNGFRDRVEEAPQQADDRGNPLGVPRADHRNTSSRGSAKAVLLPMPPDVEQQALAQAFLALTPPRVHKSIESHLNARVEPLLAHHLLVATLVAQLRHNIGGLLAPRRSRERLDLDRGLCDLEDEPGLQHREHDGGDVLRHQFHWRRRLRIETVLESRLNVLGDDAEAYVMRPWMQDGDVRPRTVPLHRLADPTIGQNGQADHLVGRGADA
mmetsp:Transcript_120206/g.347386  ORF Transcript_120206/g.347386 Transcript_120206/m.347386 type:complete len:221 (+) Transcript_120206:399-1061(+)